MRAGKPGHGFVARRPSIDHAASLAVAQHQQASEDRAWRTSNSASSSGTGTLHGEHWHWEPLPWSGL
jgi:hypothetical protein